MSVDELHYEGLCASTNCQIYKTFFCSSINSMAFVMFQCQQNGSQNWQQLVRQGVVVWTFTRQGPIKQVSTGGWSEWLRNKARQWSDLGLIKIFKIEFDNFHVILLITCIKITYTISSQLAGDTFDKNYIWCNFFNFVQSYFFCLPWFIFLGDSLCP